MRSSAVVLAATFALAGAPSATPPQGRIVFDDFAGSNDQIQLFRERPDGSGRVRLTWGGGSYLRPKWSPDGRRIVALGGPGLVVLSTDGGILHRLRVQGSPDDPLWSRDGTRIAYLVQHCQDPLGKTEPLCADLWVVRPDGTGRRRLSASGVDAQQGLGPLYSWAPDGRSIAYVSRGGLAVVDVRTGRNRLVVHAGHLVVQYPAWSPDGRWIAFAKQRAPFKGSDLLVVGPNGRGTHRLRRGSVLIPRWSPDGTRIGYLVDLPSGMGWGVVVAHADGSHPVRVGISADYQVLAWSPDSSRVLFPSLSGFQIARADGSGRVVRIAGGEEPDWGL